MVSRNKYRTQLQIVWFKRDLRIKDNRALHKAAQAGPVLPLFIVEPDLWSQSDMSARHWQFVTECLQQLRTDLTVLGQPLVIRLGDSVSVLKQIYDQHGFTQVWSHEETGNAWTYARDLRVQAWCKQNSIRWLEEQHNGVVRKLKSRNGWASKWDRFMAEPITPPPPALQALDDVELGAIPTADTLHLKSDPCPHQVRGGRKVGLKTFESFLYERGEFYRKDMSSPVTGFRGCSRLSPYLAWGVLSMREVAQATWQRQRELKALPKEANKFWRGALVSFSGRLHWHCHFIQKLEDEPRIEFENFHPAYDDIRPPEPDQTLLHAWTSAETGLPFVDACMRALSKTGWMNFRMRAMLMAVASYHLWLDWRKPGEHLARLFTDYEPGIHWPQVQMQSGTTGINSIRIYNPVKQGYDQDPKGEFVRQWLPELASVPDQFLHEPWKWSDCSTVLGKRYPFPVIDHLAAAKEARQKIWSVKRNGQFYNQADKIQNKHGSRKSGMPMTGQGARNKKKSPVEQHTLPLDNSNMT